MASIFRAHIHEPPRETYEKCKNPEQLHAALQSTDPVKRSIATAVLGGVYSQAEKIKQANEQSQLDEIAFDRWLSAVSQQSREFLARDREKETILKEQIKFALKLSEESRFLAEQQYNEMVAKRTAELQQIEAQHSLDALRQLEAELNKKIEDLKASLAASTEALSNLNKEAKKIENDWQNLAVEEGKLTGQLTDTMRDIHFTKEELATMRASVEKKSELSVWKNVLDEFTAHEEPKLLLKELEIAKQKARSEGRDINDPRVQAAIDLEAKEAVKYRLKTSIKEFKEAELAKIALFENKTKELKDDLGPKLILEELAKAKERAAQSGKDLNDPKVQADIDREARQKAEIRLDIEVKKQVLGPKADKIRDEMWPKLISQELDAARAIAHDAGKDLNDPKVQAEIERVANNKAEAKINDKILETFKKEFHYVERVQKEKDKVWKEFLGTLTKLQNIDFSSDEKQKLAEANVGANPMTLLKVMPGVGEDATMLAQVCTQKPGAKIQTAQLLIDALKADPASATAKTNANLAWHFITDKWLSQATSEYRQRSDANSQKAQTLVQSAVKVHQGQKTERAKISEAEKQLKECVEKRDKVVSQVKQQQQAQQQAGPLTK